MHKNYLGITYCITKGIWSYAPNFKKRSNLSYENILTYKTNEIILCETGKSFCIR